MKGPIWFASACLIAATAAWLAAPSTVGALLELQSGGTSPQHLSVQVLSDRLHPVPGLVVAVETPSASHAVTTNEDGQTPYRTFDLSAPIRITLMEQVLTDGIGLGMIETVTNPFSPDPGMDAYFLEVSRTQPVARPLTISGHPTENRTYLPADGDWPHWTVAVPAGSNASIPVHVAPLLDNEDVVRFLTYRGVPSPLADPYVRGVDLVVPSVQLGTSGLFISIDLLGDLPGGAVVDAYNVYTTPAAIPIGQPLEVSQLGVHHGTVYVHVQGGLRRGHLTLLARPADGPPARVEVVADDPPTVALSVGAGQEVEVALGDCCAEGNEVEAASPRLGSSVLQAAGDCEPSAPIQPDAPCESSPPPTGPCAPPTPLGEAQCQTIRSRTARICRSGGSTFQAQKAWTSKWKATFSMRGGGQAAPLSTGSGFEYGEESTQTETDAWTAQPGAHGLGQCMRYFRFELICARPFLRLIHGLPPAAEQWGIEPCSTSKLVWTICRDTATSQAVCDRTP